MSRGPSSSGDPLPTIFPRHSVNLLAAASGVGKTAFIASFLAALHRGDPVFGHHGQGITDFGYISADRPWYSDSKLWFDTAGFGDIKHYSMVDDAQLPLSRLDNKRDRPNLLGEFIEKLGVAKGALIVADPLAIFLGGNLNDYDMCARACIGVQRILRKFDVTMIGLTHSAKQKSDTGERYLRPQDRILGSMALNGYSSTQMYLLAPEEADAGPGIYQFGWTPHHAPAAVFNLRRLGNGLFEDAGLTEETVHTQRVPQPLEALSAGAQRLWAALPAPPSFLHVQQIVTSCAELGSRATLYRHLAELELACQATQPKRGTWQRVPVPPPTDNTH